MERSRAKSHVRPARHHIASLPDTAGNTASHGHEEIKLTAFFGEPYMKSPRKRGLYAMVGLIVLITALLWGWYDSRTGPRVESGSAQKDDVPTAHQAQQGLSIDELIARGTHTSDIKAAIDKSRPRTLSVCGRGDVLVRPDQPIPAALAADLNKHGATTLRNAAVLVSQRSDALSQVVALRMTMSAEEIERNVALQANPCNTEQCRVNQARWTAPSLTALVERARDTPDPSAYRQALLACQAQSNRDPCSVLSWGRFTELSPDSMEGWLFRASELASRSDTNGSTAALARAATAPDARSGLLDFQRVAIKSLDSVPEGFDRLALLTQLTDIFANQPVPSLRQITEFCSAKAVSGSERQIQCNQLSRQLQHSEAMVYLMVGSRVEQQLAHTPEQAQAIEAERNALARALAQTAPAWLEDGLSCAGVRDSTQWLIGIAQHGEAVLARKALAEQRLKGVVRDRGPQ